MDERRYEPIEWLESKGGDVPLTEAQLAGEDSKVVFYEKYLVYQTIYNGNFYAYQLPYGDILAYQYQEKHGAKVLVLYGSSLLVVASLWETQEALLPLVQRYMGREILTLDEWILSEYGESGARLCFVNTKGYNSETLSCYEKYLRIDKDSQTSVFRYADIFGIALDTSNVLRYFLCLFGKTFFTPCEDAHISLDAKEAQTFAKFIQKRVLMVRERVIFGQGEGGEIVERGLWKRYPEGKPKNKYRVLNYYTAKLYEVNLYGEYMTVTTYQYQEEEICPLQIRYRDIQSICYETGGASTLKTATLKINAGTIPQSGSLDIQTVSGIMGTDALLHIYLQLKKLVKKHAPDAVDYTKK